jgi:hypothetical protein
MSKQTINVGTVANDGTGDTLRAAGQKANANFTELYDLTGQAAGINPQTDDYTLAITDAGEIVEMNKGSAVNLTVPPNSAVPFPLKTRIDISHLGAGQVTYVAGVGVTVHSKSGNLKSNGQYGAASLYKRGTNEWLLVGDLTS